MHYNFLKVLVHSNFTASYMSLNDPWIINTCSAALGCKVIFSTLMVKIKVFQMFNMFDYRSRSAENNRG